MECTIEITTTITAVGEEEWRSLTGDHIERSLNWYKIVEESGMKKMRYVLLREGETLVAAACCSAALQKKYIEMPLLEVRSPLGTSLAFYSQKPEHTRMLLEGLKKIEKDEDARGILLLDLRKEEYSLLKSHVRGFASFLISENTYLDLNFTSFDDYLSSLSEEAWRSAKMTLNRARRWKIKTVFTKDIAKWKKTARKLQELLCKEYNDYRWYLSEEFYESVEKHMRENAELLLFFKDDTPIVFALALNTHETALYKFMGSDPEYKKYQAYFLIYYEGIRKAIERGQKRIYFGPTTYEFKEKIGCKKEELYGMGRLENPLLQGVLQGYTSISRFLRVRF